MKTALLAMALTIASIAGDKPADKPADKPKPEKKAKCSKGCHPYAGSPTGCECPVPDGKGKRW